MYLKINLLLVCSALLLSGCAGVNSDFECDATTSDRCMTMSQANQLARDRAGTSAPGKPGANAAPSAAELPRTAPVVSSFNTPSQSVPTTTPPALQSAPSGALRTKGSAVTPVAAQTCSTGGCSGAGTVRVQRAGEQVATVWIAPWIDSSDAFHQPGRISFVAGGPAWILPERIN